MRPIKLRMEGFTSFKKPVEIDFTDMTLFAITGPTGAGKTSIIDALIYALYGCTPRLGKSPSDLISQGHNELRVLLEFSSGGQRYQVSRFSKRTKRGASHEVRLEEWEGEKWAPRADKQSEVEPRIERIVGLDYNGFTKSVVLPQGRFDEFLTGKPDERRKILSELLQLEIYSRMMKRANEIAQDHKTKFEILENQLKTDFADATPEALASLTEELGKLRKALEELKGCLELVQALLPDAHRLRQVRNDAAGAETELQKIGPRQIALKREIDTLNVAVDDTTNRIKKLDLEIESNQYDSDVHANLSGIVQKAAQLEGLDKRIKEQEALQNQTSENIEKAQSALRKANSAKEAATAARQQGEKQLKSDKKALEVSVKKYGSADAVGAVIEENKKRLKAEERKSALEKDRAGLVKSHEIETGSLANLSETLASAEEGAAEARAELESLMRQHAAAELRQSIAKGKECPVCLQVVTAMPKAAKHPSLDKAKKAVDSAQQKVDKLRAGKSTAQTKIELLQQQIEDKRMRIEEIASDIAEAASKVESVLGKRIGDESAAELAAIKDELIALQKACDGSSEALESLRDAERNAERASAGLERDAAGLDEKLKQIAATLKEYRADSEALKRELGKYSDPLVARAELSIQERAKQKRDELQRQLKEERDKLAALKEKSALASGNLKVLAARASDLDSKKASLADDIRALCSTLVAVRPELDINATAPDTDAAAQLEQRRRSLQTERDQAQANVSQHEARIKQIKEKIKRAAEIRDEVQLHKDENVLAHELGRLLRADQFVAYIQQEAYHRLASDGSTYLRTLSSDRYSFGFDKDEFVAIDHWNADEPRPVATLSGGESFLASLALALALAEGLSGLGQSRGRTALESLFLDEGFGTLDVETLDVVLGGLENLTTTDRMVGIVSHVADLAERLPSRIYVGKAAAGSTIRVS
ncbi:MAG TPA: SMC family ATPase [Blastocatellia bacterium]|nr:SMC family ATPase [Blastocatellia bacterium]